MSEKQCETVLYIVDDSTVPQKIRCGDVAGYDRLYREKFYRCAPCFARILEAQN